MTTCVRLCLSFNMGCYRLQNIHNSMRKRFVDMDVVNGVTCNRQNVIAYVAIRFL